MVSWLLLVQLAHGSGATAPDTQNATTLRAGSPVEREMTAGDRQRYELPASAGQFVRVIVEQRGIDVGVELLGTDNRLIAEVDDEIGSEGREEITLVADTTGIYVLTVSAQRRPGLAGSYEIRLADTRAATDDDRRLQEARTLRSRAERLVSAFKEDEALPLAERALAIADSVSGISDAQVGRFVAALGHVYESKNNSQKAMELYDRALHVVEQEAGSDHVQTADLAGRLGLQYLASSLAPTYPLLVDTALFSPAATLTNVVLAGDLGEAVTWTNLSRATASGSDLTKTGAIGWNAGATSTHAIGAGDGFVSFTTDEATTHKMIGLSQGNTNTDFSDIAFGILLAANGTYYVFESGISRGVFGASVAGDEFQVAVKAGVVKYSKHGADCRLRIDGLQIVDWDTNRHSAFVNRQSPFVNP